MGLSPTILRKHLERISERRGEDCYNRETGRRIAAIVPMHTFGYPLRIDEVADVCAAFGIPMVEDSTESIGSKYKGKHTGRFGLLGTFSFNGNKTITSGAGGAIITDDEALARHAKHLTTTAKVPHPWEFFHDEVGYNYRMANLNAALACAQLERLDDYLTDKNDLAATYELAFTEAGVTLVKGIPEAEANNWLFTLLLNDRQERDAFLEYSNSRSVMTRPAWTLMTKLPMYEHCFAGDLANSQWLEDRLVNIPSSIRTKA
jgi:dTDP-4-amino-4,6-dideoxygalactose transaminase